MRSVVQLYPGPPPTDPSGAIAQLGERLLCKQEVVGSIPSGSTTCFEQWWCHSLRLLEKRNSPRPALVAGGVLSDIVKRRFVRMPAAHRGAWHVLPGFAGLNRSAIEQNLEEVNWSFYCRYFVFRISAEVRERASTMRVIKCLKGVRWMPWC